MSCLVDSGPSPDTNSSLLTLAPDTTPPQLSCSSLAGCLLLSVHPWLGHHIMPLLCLCISLRTTRFLFSLLFMSLFLHILVFLA